MAKRLPYSILNIGEKITGDYRPTPDKEIRERILRSFRLSKKYNNNWWEKAFYLAKVKRR